MNWKSLFKPIKSMSPEEFKAFQTGHKSDEYVLLDVRQPHEYEKTHIPGSKLIPVKQLAERLDELKRDRPIIVYCAGGVRSKAATQFLTGQGFREVFNMTGGIRQWQGRPATGTELQGIELLNPQADFADGLALAYALEDGLQQFYFRLAEVVDNSDCKLLLTRLAGFEDKHKSWLAEEYRSIHKNDQAPPVDEGDGAVMEGGRSVSQFLARIRPEFIDLQEIFDMAMMFETQALDLYSRLSVKTEIPEVKDLFLRLVEEETTHLSYLEREYERMMVRA
ncbi:MAG: sulfurtransferase [Proteobacteria bacterium]|nr:sulfurtransferase [Pseudomonadota bacterium]MBU1687502.1 sulfurtransferase [Pseudomonadota bacterium]